MKTEPKENSRIRFRDAEEFLQSAKDNLEKNRYKASLSHAVDAAISANDAFTIYFIEQVGTFDHREAINLHKEAGKKISDNRASDIALLLEERHRKAYRCVPVTRNLAEIDIKKSEKFLQWVKEKLNI